jgi:TPR repeat protein
MKRAEVWSLLFAVPLSGCGAGLFASADGYDRQACVEEAMRQRPDAKLAAAAAPELELSCRVGDAAACSALGVTYELGLGREQDMSMARGLYLKACTAKNERGCVNAANLEIAQPRSPASVAHAREMLFSACEAGEPSGCASMAAQLAKGDGVPRDVEKAERMFAKGCDGGSAAACYGLAELQRSDAKPQAGLMELYVRACVAGHQPACKRIATPPVRVAAR